MSQLDLTNQTTSRSTNQSNKHANGGTGGGGGVTNTKSMNGIKNTDNILDPALLGVPKKKITILKRSSGRSPVTSECDITHSPNSSSGINQSNGTIRLVLKNSVQPTKSINFI